jgi:hypothetical protein
MVSQPVIAVELLTDRLNIRASLRSSINIFVRYFYNAGDSRRSNPAFDR